MNYELRDRPDGQVEIVLNRPELVGVFPERDVARKVLLFLTASEAETVDEVAPLGGEPVEPWQPDDVQTEGSPARPKAGRATKVQLPAVVEDKPRPPVWLKPAPPALTEAQKDKAFERITAGEKLGAVAADIGVSMQQLRGAWAHHCRTLQAHLAGGGLQPCSLCGKPFTPSISNPETCARCSHDV